MLMDLGRRGSRAIKTTLKRSRLRPANWLPSLRAARVLWSDRGHLNSVRSGSAIDADGQPVPWYTYPAIDFLRQIDFRGKTVFEYGSGMSTLFWAQAADRVVSIEDDEAWFEMMSDRIPRNASLVLETDIARYPGALARTGEHFDVIVVDGPARGRTRLKCCRAALEALNAGGLIILDNSDWLPESSRTLREGGLIEVPMSGFVPIAAHLQTTSFYFDRRFDMRPLGEPSAAVSRGHVRKNWEQPVAPVPGALIEWEGEPFRGVLHDRTFEVAAPVGPRRFRAISYLGFDDARNIAVFDLDANRILLTRHRPDEHGETAIAGEIDRLAAISWEALAGLVARHAYRRYLLTDPAGSARPSRVDVTSRRR
jgi:hypothetical protein